MNLAELPALHIEQRPPRLLVVDDQPANIQALYQAFSADHQVMMATGGEQALKLATTKQPDLILLDVVMPGMDGHEVCLRLKADAATRDIPVIFVTAHSDEAAETQGLALGAVDFISKPINPAIVRARVKTHLTLKAQADLLRQWVYVDGLTGVRNRRGFDEQLTAEWGRAARDGSALSVILLDVDFFKRYNDHYGHQAGDACLRAVAGFLRQAVKRPGDLVARYGGEEFVCLLPGTPLEDALTFARQLGAGVEALALAHAQSTVSPVVTVSLGVCATSGKQPGSAEALLRAADAQLYAAKAAGRNRSGGIALPAP
ncbi:MAG: diguanylate cyclase [Betaproteobacteria bacterium]|nr:diguanylate cyclase [Betaproteobacteria bacterium]